jgi:hypothetical protein
VRSRLRRRLPLHDPTELARLVVGELPSAREKFRLIHWGAMIVLHGVALGEKLRRVSRFMKRHGVARARHPNDDIAVLNFGQQIPARYFDPPKKAELRCGGYAFPASASAGGPRRSLGVRGLQNCRSYRVAAKPTSIPRTPQA